MSESAKKRDKKEKKEKDRDLLSINDTEKGDKKKKDKKDKDKKDKNTQCKRTSSHPRQAAVFRNAGQGSHAGENVDGRQELFCNERLLTNACSTFTSLNRKCL